MKINLIFLLVSILVLLKNESILIVASHDEGHKITHKVFFDITIDGLRSGRIVLGLFGEVAPLTVENFRSLCLCDKDKTPEGYPLCYRKNHFHRVIPSFMMQGGDIVDQSGYGEPVSIYGGFFKDESFLVKHDSAGILSMANAGNDTNGSQFFITFAPTPWLDGKHVAFGKVIQGMEYVHRVESHGSLPIGTPTKKIAILHSGEL
ncbi:hypothetical protein CYY_003241 [Polysphondylium violaceum]|uniref:Peptidyl-prolyl cis-trans isomerase n=1 Tax=Polysphondylium violaceum TaxID=133409 RepID=A0A8J4PX22_9MYCE|nr:hypothetical protein CYY_003241 [Polysphondylium violaceum]